MQAQRYPGDGKNRFNILFLLFSISLMTIISLSNCSRLNSIDRAKRLIDEERYKDAKTILFHSDTSRPQVKILLGLIYTREKRFNKALDILESIRPPIYDETIKGEAISTLSELARLSRASNFKYIAKESYEKILDIDSEYNLGDGYRFLADYYLRRDELSLSKRYYESYINYGGDLDRILPDYLRVLYETKEYKKIADITEGHKKIPSGDANWIIGKSLYKLGVSYIEEGKPDSARLYLQRMVVTGSPRILIDDAYLHLGDISRETGDTANALFNYREALLTARKDSDTYTKAYNSIKELSR